MTRCDPVAGRPLRELGAEQGKHGGEPDLLPLPRRPPAGGAGQPGRQGGKVREWAVGSGGKDTRNILSMTNQPVLSSLPKYALSDSPQCFCFVHRWSPQ